MSKYKRRDDVFRAKIAAMADARKPKHVPTVWQRINGLAYRAINFCYKRWRKNAI